MEIIRGQSSASPKDGVKPLTIGEVDDVLVMKAAVAQGVCVAALPSPVVRESSVYVTYHKKNSLNHVLSAVRKLREAISVKF